ncbi:MAG: hypothetical protein H6742_12970 [Alphaproteobacteria bacterium]|nr:hypothetical protein [Alphaproteobacteria bacterium]
MAERTPARGPAVDGPVDEVGIDLGPDEAGHGLLDTWSGRTQPAAETSGEVTGVLQEQGPGQAAMSSWLAAGYARGADPERLAPLRGVPSRAVRARIADEPLDPLPRADPPQPAPLPEQPPAPAIPAPPPGEGEIGAPLLFVAVAVALCAGAAGAWLVLGGW